MKTLKNHSTNKTFSIAILLFLTSLFCFSQESETYTITVSIDNVKNNNGKVMLGLHSADTFMKGQGIQNAESKIEDGKITVTFENVEPGNYAILALHDENENNRMDFENGTPIESYGMSNNPMSYGPPQYNDAKFEVINENLDLKIRF